MPPSGKLCVKEPQDRRRFLYTLGGSAPLLLLKGCGRKSSYPPLTIFVLIDTLRSDHLSVYGYRRDTTPALRSFAQEATVFDWCVAPSSWTIPSMLSIFTGEPSRLIAGEVRQAHNAGLPRPDRPTLTEILKDRGNTCAGFISNGIVSRHNYLKLAFDLWELKYAKTGGVFGDITKYKDAALLLGDAFAYLRSAKLPLFLYLHLMDTHYPLNKDYCWEEKNSLRNEHDTYTSWYDGCIRYVDKQLGVFFTSVKNLGLWDESLVVVTADHGEQLGTRHHLWSHGYSVYEEEIRVPLLVKYPGINEPKRVKTLMDLSNVYHLMKEPHAFRKDLQNSPEVISETITRMPEVTDSISICRKDGLKLIKYFESNPEYRKWEMFQSPEPGHEKENLLGRRRLISYHQEDDGQNPPVYRCRLVERRPKEDASFSLHALPDVMIPVESVTDPQWNELVDDADTTDSEDKYICFLFSDLADYIYQYTHSRIKEKYIKIVQINLTNIQARIVDNQMQYDYIVDYYYYSSNEPFVLFEKNPNIKTNKISLNFSSDVLLIQPFKITDPPIHSASFRCYRTGESDMQPLLQYLNTEEGKELLDLMGHDFAIKRVFIRLEDLDDTDPRKRYGFYALLKYDLPKLEERNLKPEIYMDYAFYDVPQLLVSCRFYIPRYLKEYFRSLDFSLLRETIKKNLKASNQTLVGFSILSVKKNLESGHWDYQVKILCTKGPIYQDSNTLTWCAVENVIYTDMVISSDMPLIGNINNSDNDQRLWLISSEKELDRKKILPSLYKIIQEKQIASLDIKHKDAFQALSAGIDNHLKENEDTGYIWDTFEIENEKNKETLQALGYL